jgi:hypothetical protein
MLERQGNLHAIQTMGIYLIYHVSISHILETVLILTRQMVQNIEIFRVLGSDAGRLKDLLLERIGSGHCSTQHDESARTLEHLS